MRCILSVGSVEVKCAIDIFFAGTFCVLCTFPFLFVKCIGCSHSSSWAQLIYYGAFVVIFQFGWASVQISHLALIPNLTADPSERTELNALRSAEVIFKLLFPEVER